MSASDYRDFLAERGITIHDAADFFPNLSDVEFGDLTNDIGKNGVRVGLVILVEPQEDAPNHRRCLLDGRHRCAAVWQAFDPKDREAVLALMIDGGGSIHLSDGREVYIAPPVALHREDRAFAFDQPEPPSGDYKVGAAFDPHSYVISANAHRRHLTRKERREVIQRLLKASPERSDRQIAASAKASPTTVGSIRAHLEKSRELSKLDSRIDAAGHQRSVKHESRGISEPDPIRSEVSAGYILEDDDTTGGVVLDPWPDKARVVSMPEQEQWGAASIAPPAMPLLLPGQRIDNWEKDALAQLISRLGVLQRDPAPIANWPLAQRIALARGCLMVLKVTIDDLRK